MRIRIGELIVTAALLGAFAHAALAAAYLIDPDRVRWIADGEYGLFALMTLGIAVGLVAKDMVDGFVDWMFGEERP